MTLLAAVCAAAAGPRAAGADEAPAARPILEAQGNWRLFPVWKTPLFRRGEALEPEKADAAVSRTDLPPQGWTAADFDDRTWAAARGPVRPQGTDLALLCLRAKFHVAAKSGDSIERLSPVSGRAPGMLSPDFALTLAYRGGVVVYVNGTEVVRGHLPAGPIDPETPADDYPPEAYIDPDGVLLRNLFGDPERFPDRFALRTRRLEGVKIPASALRPGTNVLAVEVHRAPASDLLLTAKWRGFPAEQWRGRGLYWWTMLALEGLTLTAPGPPAVTPNTARPQGMQVWTANPVAAVYDQDYGDPNEPLAPVRLVGARNGVFSGLVLVGSAGAIRGLKVAARDLRAAVGGPSIPASAITVRWARPDGSPESAVLASYPRRPARFDGLLEVLPDERVPGEGEEGVTLPIWLTVQVPRDAAPGDYRGALAVSADGLAAVEVPVHLTVHDFALPDPKDFVSHVGLVQSPETLALRYEVPMWSERHWALIDQSFRYLGQVGNKVLFIPLLRRTHFGNEHTMVRWIRKPGGGFDYDFTLAEKYLDTALRHLGRPPVVCLYAWEPFTGGAYLGGAARKGRGMPFTILDRATGTLEEAEGPTWGSSEVRDFWKPIFDGLRRRLEARGLAGSMMVGVAGDSRPNKDAVEDLKAVAPEAGWVVHSHGFVTALHGQPVGCIADVWAAPVAPDPAQERLYGWQSTFMRTTFPRAGSNTVGTIGLASPLAQYRLALEGMQAAGLHGVGRVGADFWPVLKDARGRLGDVLGRYPESSWGQLNLGNAFAYLLAPGPEGPVATARFEMLRAGVQETEARIFIERALTDPARRAALGDDLARRAQAVLDQRTRDLLRARGGTRIRWLWYAAGVQDRSATLYATAAQVAAKTPGVD